MFSNRKQLVQALVKKAANDAKMKASDLASGLGAELGSVYAATQDSSYNKFFARFGVTESSYRGRIRAYSSYRFCYEVTRGEYVYPRDDRAQ